MCIFIFVRIIPFLPSLGSCLGDAATIEDECYGEGGREGGESNESGMGVDNWFWFWFSLWFWL